MKFPLAARPNSPQPESARSGSGQSHRTALRSLNPTRWSVTAKITASMLALAVLPASLVAVYNLNRGIVTVKQTELNNLKLLAISSSSRLDQLIVDTKRVVQQLGNNQDVVDYLSASPEEREQYEDNITLVLENFRLSSSDYELTYLLDADANMVAIPAFPEALGKNYAFREYYRVPKEEGVSYASTILLGTTTDEPGLYFSAPVYDDDSNFIGVAVLKMNGETIWSLVDDIEVGEVNDAADELDATAAEANNLSPTTPGQTSPSNYQSGAFLVDKYGIVIAHPNRDYLYRSLDDLPPELQAQVERDRARVNQAGSRLYGRELASANIPQLFERLVNPADPGNIEAGSVEYYFAEENANRVAGYAPLDNQSWVMVVFEPREHFQAPLDRLRTRNLITVTIVGGLAAAIALWIARSIVNPLQVLTESAQRMETNDFNPQLIAKTEQVLAQLGQERRIRRLFEPAADDHATVITQPAAARLRSALDEIPECQIVAIVNAEGTCILATTSELVGQSFQLESYFREAIKGETVLAERAQQRKMSTDLGLYFAAPVQIPGQPNPMGVVVVVLRQSAMYLADLLDAADRPDDLGQLANVFMRMASQVKVREERLKQQVTELKIEIDQSKKAKQVAEITESDYFQSLQAKAKVFRQRSNSSESQSSD